MIIGFENIIATKDDIVNKFGVFSKKKKIIDDNFLLPCLCDRCGKKFERSWRNLKRKKEINKIFCHGCVQSIRFSNKEERTRQSNKLKLYYENPENKQKASKAILKHYSEHPETKIKQSTSAKKRFEKLEEREKTSKAGIKRFEDQNLRSRISNSQKKRYEQVFNREKVSKGLKQKWKDPLYRKKCQNSLVKYFSKEESRLKSSEASKKIWENEEYKKKMIPVLSKNRLIKNGINKEEKIVLEILKTYDINFRYVGSGENVKYIAGFCPDFLNEPRKLIVEHNGCFWHKCKQCYPDRYDSFLNRDLGKLHAYQREGYRFLFTWSHDLKDLEKLCSKIERFIYEPELFLQQIVLTN